MQTIRPAAVAGMFYPGDPAVLARDVETMLVAAAAHAPKFRPKALIAPHAGYIYSGAIAASAYALLQPIAGRIRRVVLLGPTHRVAVRGLALPDVDALSSPLGTVEIDQAAIQQIAGLPQVVSSAQVHAQEHSLEVHLPFLQKVLPDFKILPLAVGMASAEEVAEVLETLWGGEETLIVVSSDLSHYLPYDTARRVDVVTAREIMHLRQPISHEQACGGTPINGLLLAAQRHHLTPHLLDLRNSGDTAGDKNRVVGYAAFAFCENAYHGEDSSSAGGLAGNAVAAAAKPDAGEAACATEHTGHGEILLRLARGAIAEKFGGARIELPAHDWLKQPGATFVTLTQNGNLRGCIGSLAAYRPLGEDVCANALAAAFQDPRFPAMQPDELDRTRVEVSLLTPAQPMLFKNERDALAQLRPNIDGVIFEYDHYRSTFLPQVWEQLPTPEAFMTQLKRKAGLPGNFWAEGVKLSRYGVEKWKETQ